MKRSLLVSAVLSLALPLSGAAVAGAVAGAVATPSPASSPSASAALLPAGMVKRVSGQVLLQRAGQPPQAVSPGQRLLQGDVLRTGAASAVGVTLADDTLLSAGADSELLIDRFAFDTTTQDGNIVLRLWRGSLAVVTGLVARRAPQNMSVHTRTVVLGVRGTEFIVDAGSAEP